MLTECREVTAIALLEGHTDRWAVPAMDLAISGASKAFVAHEHCQQLIDRRYCHKQPTEKRGGPQSRPKLLGPWRRHAARSDDGPLGPLALLCSAVLSQVARRL